MNNKWFNSFFSLIKIALYTVDSKNCVAVVAIVGIVTTGLVIIAIFLK